MEIRGDPNGPLQAPRSARCLALPVSLATQIQPDTFEYAVNWIVDHDIDLSAFDAR